jgi:hypothetical protein
MNPLGARWIPALMLMLLFIGQSQLARAQEKSVGGHVGFGFPLVS